MALPLYLNLALALVAFLFRTTVLTLYSGSKVLRFYSGLKALTVCSSLKKTFMVLTLIFSASFFAHAHETESSDSIPFEEIYAEILSKAAALDYQEIPEHSSNFEPHLIGAKKYLLVGPRTYVKIDNAFWDLADSLSKLYVSEFERVCEECRMPALDELQSEAKALVAKGWFSENSKKFKEVLAYRYAGAFVTLGGRYGPTAGVIKLVGELMEEVMLVVFKLPGAHIFCEVITAAIAVYAGKTNTLMRSFSLAQQSNMSFMSQPRALARLMATSYVMKRSLKRMAIEVKRFEIDEHELEHFLEDEKESKLIHKITGRHRVRNFINKLAKKVESKNRKNNSDQDEVSYFKELRRKSFEGHRYGMSIFLKKRKQTDSLGEFADNGGKLTRRTHFWVMGLTNDILDPLTELKSKSDGSIVVNDFESSDLNRARPINTDHGVQTAGDLEGLSAMSAEDIQTASLDQSVANDLISGPNADAITEHQLSAYPTEHPDNLARIFSSLDAITDYEGRSMRQRRIELAFFQSYMAGVVPRLMNDMVESVLGQYDPKDKRLLKVYGLYYKLGQIYYNAELLIDFLRFASVAKSSSDPFIKYHVRDYFSQIQETLGLIAEFENARQPNQLDDLVRNLDQRIKEISNNRFWIEKKSSLKFLPKIVSQPLGYVFHPIEKIKTFAHYIEDLHAYGWVGSSDLQSPNARYKRPKFQTGAPSCESLYL